MNELHIMLGNGKGVNSWCNGVRFVLIHTFQMRSKLVDVLLLVAATSWKIRKISNPLGNIAPDGFKFSVHDELVMNVKREKKYTSKKYFTIKNKHKTIFI
jgi:hypothetical protein